MFVLFWYIPYSITGKASKTYVKLVGWIMFLVDTPSHTLIKKYYVTICVPLILTNFVEYKLVIYFIVGLFT
jgi:hypothetical protein